MRFQHSVDIWRDFPQLVPGVLYAEGITCDAPAGPAATGGQPGPAAGGGQTSAAAGGGQPGPAARGGQPGPAARGGQPGPAADRFTAIAKARLAAVAAESELPEIQAWRRAFAAMGLKPTQYRCASESLLRRFRKEGSLPRLHPLVDLCNAVSLAFAIPVAVFDLSAVTGPLEVRYATGDEEYVTFADEIERPAAGEVIFADQAGQAHARRWTNRQSGRSAVRDSTSAALIVAEALHDTAPSDVPELVAALAAELQAAWSVTPHKAVLTAASPRFTVKPGASAERRDAAGPHTSGQRRDPQ